MPAPKIDLNTPHGRIQYARVKAGFDQVQFARLMGYDSPSGWQKIEQGKIKVNYDHIIKTNEILKLDIRYYFGLVDYESSKQGNPKSYDDLVKEIKRLSESSRPIEKLDSVAEKIMISQPHHELMEIIQYWDAVMLRQFSAMAHAYLTGKRDEAGKKSDRSINGNGKKIGIWLVENGYLSHDDVITVLMEQKNSRKNKKFGEIAIELKLVDQKKIDEYLIQHGKKEG